MHALNVGRGSIWAATGSCYSRYSRYNRYSRYSRYNRYRREHLGRPYCRSERCTAEEEGRGATPTSHRF